MSVSWARYSEVSVSQGKLVENLTDSSTNISKKIIDLLNSPKPEIYRHEIRVKGEEVGELFLMKNIPLDNDVTIHSLVVNDVNRGHAYGTKALLAVERKLSEMMVCNFWAVNLIINGRGTYFLLRAGFTPSQNQGQGELNWFIRGGQK
ncbi:MAG: hypothetical protein CL792_01920 [Chloroflexi bacterium]|nr:hypothetical protein [Chloroflexota bacterium]